MSFLLAPQTGGLTRRFACRPPPVSKGMQMDKTAVTVDGLAELFNFDWNFIQLTASRSLLTAHCSTTFHWNLVECG